MAIDENSFLYHEVLYQQTKNAIVNPISYLLGRQIVHILMRMANEDPVPTYS
jgi:hypothetical protein